MNLSVQSDSCLAQKHIAHFFTEDCRQIAKLARVSSAHQVYENYPAKID